MSSPDDPERAEELRRRAAELRELRERMPEDHEMYEPTKRMEDRLEADARGETDWPDED